jgi:hypothetical protein
MEKSVNEKPQRKYRERQVSCDTDRLYGPIPGAIEYLTGIHANHPLATLKEQWDGYEDMRMVFAWWEPETDDEFESRLRAEALAREFSERRARDAAEKEAARKQIAALQRKHGL